VDVDVGGADAFRRSRAYVTFNRSRAPFTLDAAGARIERSIAAVKTVVISNQLSVVSC
jgi:hypothetical protein